MGFGLAELSMACPADFPSRRADLVGVRFLRGSDAHRVEQIPERPSQFMELDKLDRASVIAWLRRRNAL